MKTKENFLMVVSVMGSLLMIVVNFAKYIHEFGGSVGQCLYFLAEPKGEATLKTVSQLIAEAGLIANNIFNLIVDYSMPLADLIALGKFDGVDHHVIPDNFPNESGKDKQKVVVELWHPDKYFGDGQQVIDELAKAKPGYRFATLWELLTLVVKQPDLQRQFPIAALGSIWIERPNVGRFVFLYGNDSERHIDIQWLKIQLYPEWRFAVVRESV